MLYFSQWRHSQGARYRPLSMDEFLQVTSEFFIGLALTILIVYSPQFNEPQREIFESFIGLAVALLAVIYPSLVAFVLVIAMLHFVQTVNKHTRLFGLLAMSGFSLLAMHSTYRFILVPYVPAVARLFDRFWHSLGM